MYAPLLTRRYLRSRVIPLVAVAAVALCVALVIIVVSVMTGFLEMVKSSGRTLMGDVIIAQPVSGIPHYDRLLSRLRGRPEVAAATPVVDTWGLLQMPYPDGPNKDSVTVQVWGVDAETFTDVTGFEGSLWWRPIEPGAPDVSREDFRHQVPPQRLAELFDAGRHLENPDGDSPLPPITLGMHVSVGNERQRDGTYTPALGGYWWMPKYAVTLTTLPVVGGGFAEPESVRLQVVNEFVSGVFLIDEKRVIVPVSIAQRLTGLDEGEIVDLDDPDRVLGVDPARATMLLVRGADGVSPDELRVIVASAYEAFRAELLADADAVVKPPPAGTRTVQTWEQQQSKFIAPIEKERELMRTLFSLVYLVCAGLVLAIFWAIVYEKTRDIGILRSVGASRLGISWIFLRYGFVIGVLGAIVGLGLGALVVHQINAIHEALADPPTWLAVAVFMLAGATIAVTVVRARTGRLLPVMLGGLVALVLLGAGTLVVVVKRLGGVVIWDPSVYYFTSIPNDLDVGSAAITMVGAVLFSLIGAFLPAAKAADTDPVQALRYE